MNEKARCGEDAIQTMVFKADGKKLFKNLINSLYLQKNHLGVILFTRLGWDKCMGILNLLYIIL